MHFLQNPGLRFHHKLAKKYDPFRAANTTWLAGLYCYDGQYEKAVETVYESFEVLKDNLIGLYILGITYLKMGRSDEAIEAHKKLAELYPGWEWALGFTYATAGYTAEAKEIARKIEKGNIGIFRHMGLSISIQGSMIWTKHLSTWPMNHRMVGCSDPKPSV